MATAQPQAADELHMLRFKGLETYQIGSARWSLHQSDDPPGVNFCIRVASSKAISQFEDTRYVGGLPNWELNLVESKIEDASLVAGFKASIPLCYDETRGGWITSFYFSDYEGSEKNEIEILAREEDRLLLRLTAEIRDVIHYDDSKPRSKVSVVTWFTWDEGTKRSMQ